MRGALRRRHSGVAEHFLDDADVHALLNQQSRGRVPGIVDPGVADLRLSRIAFQARQSSLRSIGPPRRVANTRSWSVHELPALSRSAVCLLRCSFTSSSSADGHWSVSLPFPLRCRKARPPPTRWGHLPA